MSKPLPSLKALRAFESTARHLSFNKAAKELYVTTAAVSQQVKSLEDQLGIILFHRLSRGLELTEAGLAGLPQLQKAFCLLTKGVAQIRGSQTQDLLTIESAPAFAAKWLLPRLKTFYARHPEIDLRIAGSLRQLDSGQHKNSLQEQFQIDEIDIAIRFGNGNYPGCQVDSLFEVSVMPLCSPTLVDGEHPLQAPSDLRFHTLLHDDTPWAGRPAWRDWFAAAKITELNAERGMRFNSVQLTLQAAMDGQGIALSSAALAADDISAGYLVAPFDIQLPLDNAYYLVTMQDDADLPQIAAFRQWIVDEAEQFRQEFQAPNKQPARLRATRAQRPNASPDTTRSDASGETRRPPLPMPPK